MTKNLALCSKQQSEDLKTVGFDWPVKDFYWLVEARRPLSTDNREADNFNADLNKVSAPTIALAIQWLRNVKKIWVVSMPCYEGPKKGVNIKKCNWAFYDDINKYDYTEDKDFDTIEESDSAGLTAALSHLLTIKKTV